MQATSHLLMIRPVDFKFNTQTAGDNKFQIADNDLEVQQRAEQEFDNLVDVLRKNGILVKVVNDTLEPETPDSIFPNNWVSFHQDGSVFLYPMHSPNRRLERRSDIIEQLKAEFEVQHIIDLSFYESQNIFLEGTGSMVLDRVNKLAYACMSVRTDAEAMQSFCAIAGYSPVTFRANDPQNFPIYHTNVMMCIAEKYAVICSESITDEHEREYVLSKIKQSGKEIITISYDQMNHFAGNMLELSNAQGESLLVMSQQAFQSLRPEQIKALEKYSRIISAPLNTIEKNGGGSARCMLAEIHLPLRKS